MPLRKGGSDATRSANIAEMIRAGYKPRVAAAASYRQQRQSKRRGRKSSRS